MMGLMMESPRSTLPNNLASSSQDHLVLLNDFPFNRVVEVPTVGNAGGLTVLWDDPILELLDVATTDQEIHAIMKVSVLLLRLTLPSKQKLQHCSWAYGSTIENGEPTVMLVRKLYNNLEIGLHEKPSVETCCASIVSTARSLYNLYRIMEQNIGPIEPPTSRRRYDDLDDEMGEELGLQCCRINDFDSYLSQERENIRDETGKQQLLSWWKTRIRQFSKLSRMVRDLLSAQASLVASEQAFSAGRFIIGDHRYSSARDSLKISVLFRDWINAERRNFGLPKLPPYIEDEIDEIFEENSDDEMEAMEEQGNRPIPEDLSAEE
ncbi:putative acyl carrier protein 1, chloroplastic-like [Capsicum annuum]|nr:putative acyl carrier protein 1, chloroplastic-like [Capsicum annuum]